MIKVLAAEPRSKKGNGDEAFEVFLAASPLDLPHCKSVSIEFI